MNFHKPVDLTTVYTNSKAKAWRNLMVAGINAALDQSLLSLDPERDVWSTKDSLVFDFEFPGGIPCLGYISDCGYDEVTVHVAANPTSGGRWWVTSGNAGFHAGEAFTYGWLERRMGLWLQSGPKAIKCRKALIEQLATPVIAPKGYRDKGRFCF